METGNNQTNENIVSNVDSNKSSTESVKEGQNIVNEEEASKAVKKRKIESMANDSTAENEGKSSRQRSWTWDHFTKNNDQSNPRAKCNWCGKTYACDSHRNGTKNLSNHLEQRCKKFPRERFDATQKTLSLQPLKKEEGKGTGSSLVGIGFDADACRKALARMIIVDELPFKFVEGEGFRYFMSIVQPRLSIPSRITIARECWGLYTAEKHKVKSIFSKSSQGVCLTTDCWTSVQNLNYLCLTAHFIDNDWKLHKQILNFCPIEDHKGKTIGKKIEKCLESWLIGRVFTITVDNASSNDVAIAYLKDRMEDWNSHPLKGEHMHVRCCAHIINLVVGDGLKDLHESINKIRSAVRHVRASPSRMDRFKKYCKEARIQDESTVQLDVPTRWNSTYIMLESALKFQKGFKRLSEKNDEFKNMPSGIPESVDWENAKCFVKFLKFFYDITKKMSGSTYVTSSLYFNEHCVIMLTLDKWIASQDPLLSTMAVKMKAKYVKYWGNTEKMNVMIFIAIILDPQNKFHFVKWGLEKIYESHEAEFLIEKIKIKLYGMYDRYKLFLGEGEENSGQHSHEMANLNPDANVEISVAMEFEKDMSLNETMSKNEVDLYLMEAREKKSPTFDILNWWKVNSTKYPVLAQIARDVLAMPVSTVASESAFSTGGRVLNCYRSSLSPKTVEALVCSQNWFRSTSVATDVEELLEDLEKLEKDLEPIPQLNEDDCSSESD